MDELEENMKEEKRKQDKKLIKHCRTLFELAQKAHPGKKLEKYQRYYNGDFDDIGDTTLNNYYNIIQTIVETKVALTLDNDVTTSVAPQPSSFSDLSEIQTINDIADIMNEGLIHVQRINKFDDFKDEVTHTVDIMGVAIAEVTYDPDLNNIGDISIKPIDPQNFFPDPNAKEIVEANYIHTKEPYSAIDLKRMFPERIDDIDRLLKKSSNTEKNPGDFRSPSGSVVTLKTDAQPVQVYSNEGTKEGFEYLQDNIMVYRTFLKDDATFIPDKDASNDVKQTSFEIGFKYPNGRMIMWAGDDLVFEDKPIEDPTGFPFVKMNLIKTKTFWGQGDVEGLMYIQDRINKGYNKLRSLIGAFLSVIITEEGSGIENDGDLIDAFIVMVETGTLREKMPQVLTNNTLAEIENMLKYLQELKTDAKNLARVNDMMLSGQKPSGVNSGKMVEALNESPLTSITAIQKRLNQFLIDISNKALILMQTYYNTPRIIRMAEGKEFIQLGVTNAMGEPEITKLNPNMEEDIKIIKGDLSLAQYEVEVVAGTKLPRTKEAQANIMMELYKNGLLGDPNDIDVKSMLLQELDVRNSRAIIQMQRKKQEEMAGEPAPIPPIEKMTLAFKDLPLDAQNELLKKAGLPGNSIKEFVPELVEVGKTLLDHKEKEKDREHQKQQAQDGHIMEAFKQPVKISPN